MMTPFRHEGLINAVVSKLTVTAVILLVLFNNISCAQTMRTVVMVPSFVFDLEQYFESNTTPPAKVKSVLDERISDLFEKNSGQYNFHVKELSAEESSRFFLSLPVPDDSEKLGVDYFLWGAVDARNHELELQLVSTETARSIKKIFDLNDSESNVLDKVVDAIDNIINQPKLIEDIETVKAEGIASPYNSVVYFDLKTFQKKNLRLYIDYDGLHEYVQSYEINLYGQDGGSQKSLVLQTIDGHKINLKLNSSADDREVKIISTDYSPHSNGESDKDFVVESVKGYKIIFHFKWINNDLSTINVYPENNPYEPFAYSL